MASLAKKPKNKSRHEEWAFHAKNEKPKVRGKNHDFTVQFAGHERIAIVTNYMGNKASRTGPHMLLVCHCRRPSLDATHLARGEIRHGRKRAGRTSDTKG
jgi:hypothetical protein